MWLTREAGQITFNKLLYFDMTNSHASLMYKALVDLGVADEFQSLAAAVTHPHEWRTFVARYFGVSVDEAKKLLISIMCHPNRI